MTGGAPTAALTAIDIGVGGASAALRLARRAAAAAARRTPHVVVVVAQAGGEAAVRLAGDLPERLREQGTDVRGRTLGEAERRLLATVRPILDLVLDQLDLTQTVLQRVDIDRVASALDIERFLDRLDLTQTVLKRVDLDRIASALDVDAVAQRLDVDAVAKRIDVDAVAQRLDVDAVIDRVDLIGLADEVVDGIDLPRIIRDSTGSVASESIRGVRTRSIEADEALGTFMDRFRVRRRPTADPALEGPGAD